MIPLLLSLACTGTSEETGPVIDTGWFDDTAAPDTGACGDLVTETDPVAGETDVYWRDPMYVLTSSDDRDAYGARLLDASGAEVPATMVWGEGGAAFELWPDEPLSPVADHVLELTDCAGTTEIPFVTADYGLPLEGGTGTLVGNTYVIELSEAYWEEPSGFGTILSLYFTTPVLIGVEWADERMLDLIGGQGYTTGDGEVAQNMDEVTWDFPAADFDEHPYFHVQSEQISMKVEGVDVDIYDFDLQGTFSPDGERLGGARISGLGDTRNMGPIFGKGDDPGAICGMASAFGAICEDCPDGEPYCLFLKARSVYGEVSPGLRLERVASE